MKNYLYTLLLIGFAGCRVFVGGGGPPVGPRYPDVIFNVCSNSGDSCRCRANHFAADSNFGYRCRPIDSAIVTQSALRNTLDWHRTDTLGLTGRIPSRALIQRFYISAKGFPNASVILNFNPKTKMPIKALGCDAFSVQSFGNQLGAVYYVTVVINPNPKKGVKLVPYKPSAN